MTEFLPAILAADEAEFVKKVAHVKALGLTLHIDVMDGEFVPQKTWAVAERMRELLGDTPFEAHLMVANPEHAVPLWFACGATRVIFHLESTPRSAMLCRATAERCKDLCVAINPETPVSHLTELLPHIDQTLVMGVKPGMSGQAFQEIAIEKVKALRDLKPKLRIAVDGGVKPGNADALAEAGADALIVGSALTDEPDSQFALQVFRNAIEPMAPFGETMQPMPANDEVTPSAASDAAQDEDETAHT